MKPILFLALLLAVHARAAAQNSLTLHRLSVEAPDKSLTVISNKQIVIARNASTPDRGDLVIDHTPGPDPIVSFGYNIVGDLYHAPNTNEAGFGYMIEGHYEDTIESYFTMRPTDPRASYIRPFMTRIDSKTGVPRATWLAGGGYLTLGLIDGQGTDVERMTGHPKLVIRASGIEAAAPLRVTGAVTADALNARSISVGTLSPYDDGTKNDFDPGPDGFLNILTDRFNFTLTGLAGGSPGRVLFIFNRTPAMGTVYLLSNDSRSAATNRFLLPGTFLIAPLRGASFIYNGPLQRWVSLQ